MYKFIGLIPRREDVTREYFANYYESQHTPLALKYFRGFAKYLRNHIVDELSGSAAEFDVFSEFWYESIEELAKTGEFLESDLAPIIRNDENQFMNQPGLITLTVDEQLLSGPPRCLEPETEKLILCVKRRSDQSLEEFHKKMLNSVREQLENWGAHRVCCSLVQQPEDEAPWDAVLFVWPGDTRYQQYVEALVSVFESLTAQHLLVRTRSVETDLSAAYQSVPAEQGATCEL